MNAKRYFLISGGVFCFVALMHLSRLLYQWPVQLGAWEAPMAASAIGLVISGLLSLWAFQLWFKK